MSEGEVLPIYGILTDTDSVILVQNQLSSLNFDGGFVRTTELKQVADIIIGDIISYENTDLATDQIKFPVVDLDEDDLGNILIFVYDESISETVQYTTNATNEDGSFIGTEEIYIEYENFNESDYGSSGWAISKYGNAIFSNVSVRGEINATSGSISGNLEINDNMILGSSIFLEGDASEYSGIRIDENNYLLSSQSIDREITVTSISITTEQKNSSLKNISITLSDTSGFSENETIDLFGFSGDLTFLNGSHYIVQVIGNNIFINANSELLGTYSVFEVTPEAESEGFYERLTVSSVSLSQITYDINIATVTSANHGLLVDDLVTFENSLVAGLETIGGEYQPYDITTNTFKIEGVEPIGTYTGLSEIVSVLSSSKKSKFKVGGPNNSLSYDSLTDILNVTGSVNATSGTFLNTISIGSGTNKIRLIGTDSDITTKIAISSVSTPAWANTNTPFYVDATGKFSLGDGLIWNPNAPATLEINGILRGYINSTTAVPLIPVNSMGVGMFDSVNPDLIGQTGTVNGLTLTVTDTSIFSVGMTLTKTSGTGVFGIDTKISSINSTTSMTLTTSAITNGSIIFTGGMYGVGLKINKNNYWFADGSPRFKIGSANNYLSYTTSPDKLTVTGEINAKSGAIGSGSGGMSKWYIGDASYDSHGTIQSFPLNLDSPSTNIGLELDSSGYIDIYNTSAGNSKMHIGPYDFNPADSTDDYSVGFSIINSTYMAGGAAGIALRQNTIGGTTYESLNVIGPAKTATGITSRGYAFFDDGGNFGFGSNILNSYDTPFINSYGTVSTGTMYFNLYNGKNFMINWGTDTNSNQSANGRITMNNGAITTTGTVTTGGHVSAYSLTSSNYIRSNAVAGAYIASNGRASGTVASQDLGFLADDRMIVTATNQSAATIQRLQDGVLLYWTSGTSNEGSVSVSGTTVSYGSFAGSHWSQIAGATDRIDILPGTVLESVDEMCEWIDQDGNVLPNDQLAKVKISDTDESSSVYGVFQRYDDDDDEFTNDIYVMALGAWLCRIDANENPSIGDLLVSAGNGCAKVQSDDIIRSKTIGKVTSTQKYCTYDDGSYVIPVVLYCG